LVSRIVSTPKRIIRFLNLKQPAIPKDMLPGFGMLAAEMPDCEIESVRSRLA